MIFCWLFCCFIRLVQQLLLLCLLHLVKMVIFFPLFIISFFFNNQLHFSFFFSPLFLSWTALRVFYNSTNGPNWKNKENWVHKELIFFSLYFLPTLYFSNALLSFFFLFLFFFLSDDRRCLHMGFCRLFGGG